MKKETRLATRPTPPLPAVPVPEPDWVKTLRDQARDQRAKAVVGIPRLTHKGRVLKLDGQKLKDDFVQIVPLGYCYVKADYEEAFEEGSTATPRCYAFGDDLRRMVAHPASPELQNKQPDGTSPCGIPGTPGCCPHNNFGTALKGGGKHCGDKVRILFLLASDLAKNGEEEMNKAINKAQHYQVDIPATSINIKEREGCKFLGFNQYLASLAGLTTTGSIQEAIVEINTESREKGGYFVTLRFMEKVPDAAMPALIKRATGAWDLLAQPFPVFKAGEAAVEEEAKPLKGQAKAAGKKRGKNNDDEIPF